METTPAANGRPVPHDPTLLPEGSRSFSKIAVQAFALGASLSLCSGAAILLALCNWSLWRIPAFIAWLSLFHFLEFYTTARYNVPAARASSFLLFNNGAAYNLAHGMALVELVVANFIPRYQRFLISPGSISVGLLLIVVGQVVRSVAMAQAGTNFNHIVAQQRRDSHVLVTGGIYSCLRHPSYFGFFWWALGTQLMVGNKLCFVAYAVVLWRFFSRRIQAEEKFLVQFFGEDYVVYRDKTKTYIPLIA